jgi:hypothetical protein
MITADSPGSNSVETDLPTRIRHQQFEIAKQLHWIAFSGELKRDVVDVPDDPGIREQLLGLGGKRLGDLLIRVVEQTLEGLKSR